MPVATQDLYLQNMRIEYVSNNKDLRRVAREYEHADIIGYDFETSGLDVHTDSAWLVSLCQIGSNIVHVIDVQRCKLSILKDVLERATLIGADIKFDLKWSRKYGIRPRSTHCTVITSRLLTAGKNEANSLAAACEKELGFSLEKEARNSFIMHPESVRRLKSPPKWTGTQKDYAAADVFVLEEIRDAQLREAAKEDLIDVANLENALVPVVSDMEYDGVYVDEEEWLALEEINRSRQTAIGGEVCDLLASDGTQTLLFPELTGTRYKINLNSGPEMKSD